MRILKDLKQNIEEILKKYPEWENLPLIFSSDDEGNSYHYCHNDLSPAQTEDINNKYYLEIVGFFDDTNPNDDDRDISVKDVNCICIN